MSLLSLLSAFDLLFEIQFIINLPSVSRIFAHCKRSVLRQQLLQFAMLFWVYAIFNLIMVSIGCINGCDVGKNEVKSQTLGQKSLGKTVFHFLHINNLTNAITRIHSAVCKMRSNNSNLDYCCSYFFHIIICVHLEQ